MSVCVIRVHCDSATKNDNVLYRYLSRYLSALKAYKRASRCTDKAHLQENMYVFAREHRTLIRIVKNFQLQNF